MNTKNTQSLDNLFGTNIAQKLHETKHGTTLSIPIVGPKIIISYLCFWTLQQELMIICIDRQIENISKILTVNYVTKKRI